jgi:hypothetical protein
MSLGAQSLHAAHERIVVDLADDALVAMLVALSLEHPTLNEPPFAGAPPTLQRARALARAASRLRIDIERYRAAVDNVLEDLLNEDIPF